MYHCVCGVGGWSPFHLSTLKWDKSVTRLCVMSRWRNESLHISTHTILKSQLSVTASLQLSLFLISAQGL